jgi:hypothetical protein
MGRHRYKRKPLLQYVARFILGPLMFERLLFCLRHRYWPHFHNPRSHNERIVHRKLFAPAAAAAMLSDKIAVRTYVAEHVGSQYLNEVYWTGTTIALHEWDALPQVFVVKGTHGSGLNYMFVVRDKSQWTYDEFSAAIAAILKRRFGRMSCEPWYGDITPRIIIEKLLVDAGDAAPRDYKFYVFHGRVHYIHVNDKRFINMDIIMYDRDWNVAPFRPSRWPVGAVEPKPAMLDQAIVVAEKLAAGYDFMRVDLYLLPDNRIVFGELTSTPGAGHAPFRPDAEYDFKLGDLWIDKTDAA